MDKIAILDKIVEMVTPLKPPVQAFEKSIRRAPFKILVSVLLSSRTKDPVTQKASENLFAEADMPGKMMNLEEGRIAQLIFPVGFYRQKAKHIKKLSQMLCHGNDGNVPGTFEGLAALPGVGRKTANLVLALAFNQPAICVDTHVFRISQRLGWASGKKPGEIEEQLRKGFPPEQWNRINHTLVGFGQTLCKPVSPLCGRCVITGYCLYYVQWGGIEEKKRRREEIGAIKY
ncbi:MAG: endonuclease III [Candidatus Aminicenantes bacterium]|nr:endonuclease III [Candidatus Aminicenantes bacterium]